MAKTALIVDDSVTMRQMVAFTLTQAGFEVIEACNGQEALERADTASVQLVITDLNMPVMDGLTLIRQLRTRPQFRSTPILTLTTEVLETKKQEARSAGATGWIVKPFDPEQLCKVVNKIVG